MEFNVPFLKPKSVDCSDLPLFDFEKFSNKELIGNGGYGAVFTAEYRQHGVGNPAVTLVIKKMLGEDLENKKNFVKEARILKELEHPNIVHGNVQYTTGAYSRPFGINLKVSSLAEFVATLDSFNCEGCDSPHIFSGICKDIATGLQYLHNKDIAHRDLKPANVLVSNQHYCKLSRVEIGKAWKECSVVCKLADFGESRSREVQTQSILKSQTNRVNRGTPVYMAPEILVDATRLAVATIEDMKMADIWALGMTLFVLLNPCVKYPYQREIERATEKGQTSHQRLEGILADKKIPIEPIKYQHKHATDWYSIQMIYKECVQFSPESRPMINKVI
ncbi:Serine/threonine-protein kinase ulk2 [Desmophyllum pertusum]|uniref:Serine/threonine-protein kinase ulk2 n=1 Tax=Desmophyllum pertusum TaxID=174260 RepID=A0A9X0A472_9CNID|nr:Serine/threonine-protein kinase ulk2 [Desmophyllum pertusum]